MFIDLHTKKPLAVAHEFRSCMLTAKPSVTSVPVSDVHRMLGRVPRASSMALFEDGAERALVKHAAHVLDRESLDGRIFVQVGDEYHAVGWSRTPRVVTQKDADAAYDRWQRLEEARQQQEQDWYDFQQVPVNNGFPQEWRKGLPAPARTGKPYPPRRGR